MTTTPGTYGTVVLPGVGMCAPGMKTANGYVIIKGGEAVIKLHGDVVDFLPVAVPRFTFDADDYEILWKRQGGWSLTRWWRVIDPDGRLWCETSSEAEARAAVRPGDRLERLWKREHTEWRPA